MTFFDLNIPYTEPQTLKPSPATTPLKTTRLKTTVKAMELGYSGIAYNRSMSGVMSDADRCSISLFPLSSLLKSAPSLAASVKFHRQLLGVNLNSPFRQYTRLTVSVESAAQASALNSGNPVIKSYHLIAVKPLNQIAFDNACKVCEVDLIAIDFAEKLPFRLKLPMIKAAIERGIYFEITYSRFISDVQTRRQMITNAKLLVDWTRGKNLIFSSAAASVNELRGPHDAANLSSLLGLSMERAKAAVSKNCRSLLASALRKKQFFKETIKAERIFSAKPMNPKEPWFGDGRSWDNISSGEGDLLLDDIAKSFSAYREIPKTPKPIDFSSIVKEMPSNGMRLKDWLADGEGKLQLAEDTTPILSVPKELTGLTKTNEFSYQSNSIEPVPLEDRISLASTPVEHQISDSHVVESLLQDDIPAVLTGNEDIGALTTSLEEPQSSDAGVAFAVGISSHDTPAEVCYSGREENPFLADGSITLLTPVEDIETSPCNIDPMGSSGLDVFSFPKDQVSISTIGSDLVAPMETAKHFMPSNEVDRSSFGSEISGYGAQDVTMEEGSREREGSEQTDLVLAGCDMSIDGNIAESGQHGQLPDDLVPPADAKLLAVPYYEMQEATFFADKVQPCEASFDMENQQLETDAKIYCLSLDKSDGLQEATLVADKLPPEEASFEMQNQLLNSKIYRQSLDKTKSANKVRVKQKTSRGVLPFPFKRLLMPLHFSRRNLRKCRTR